MAIQQYKFDILTYYTNDSVRSDCADITFYNQGATAVILNNSIRIPAGASLSLSANFNEIDRTIYTFYFIASGTASQKLVVFRKVYI